MNLEPKNKRNSETVNMRIGRLILETDAQKMVRAVKIEGYHESDVGHLLEEIKSLVTVNFISFECIFVGRLCNKAAHESLS